MRGLVRSLVLCLALIGAAAAVAQDGPVPERRTVTAEGLDFYGSDLRTLFDTSLGACQRACLDDAACEAFTFNARSNACFPKSAVTEIRPYDGAVSARVIDTDAAVLSAAPARAADLDFLDPMDLLQARGQAEGMADRHRAGLDDAATIMGAAQAALARGDRLAAIRHLGAAITLTDAAEHWLDYARLLAGQREEAAPARAEVQGRALSAAVNAYLRAGPDAQRASALEAIAEALIAAGRGRDAIPALRLALRLDPRPALDAALASAIGRFGFRIVRSQVDNEAAAPRICAVFSEDLSPVTEYAPFVGLAEGGLAVTAEGRQLCVEGVDHGARYQITFRAGLPALSGERLERAVEVTHYVRDRSPAVRFPTRAYVLPRGADPALPVETVNAPDLDLSLARVSDRNVLRAMQDGLFARPVPVWQMEDFNTGIAEEVWTGRAEVPTEINRDMTTRLPLAGLPVDLSPGLYTLTARIPGTDPWDVPPATQWFVISDIGLTTLWGVDGLTVIARSLATGAPLSGLDITLLSRSNRELARAVTDAEGLVRFAPGLTRGTGGARPGLIVAGAAGDGIGQAGAPDPGTETGARARDMAFLSLTDPEFDLSDRGVAGREAAPPVDLFVTTDRGAYRAGETVHLTALARDEGRDGGGAIDGLPLTVRMIRPDGVEHARHLSRGVGAGGHVLSLPIAAGAPRGTWRLEVLGDPDAPPLARTTVLVEDFLPERIDFDLSLPGSPIRPGDAPQVGIEARYLFGAPAADLAIEGEAGIAAQDGLDAFPGYVFGRHDQRFSPVQVPLPLGLRTDASGRAEFAATLPTIGEGALEAAARPLALTVTARLSEGSGRPVERSVTRALAPPVPLIGIRPLFDDVVAEGDSARFAVIAVGQGDRQVPARVRWTVDRIETRYQWYQLYGDWNWEPVTTRARVAEGEAAPDGTSPAEIAVPVGPGRHEIRVERIDVAPGTVPAAASTEFWAGWYAPAETPETPDALPVALDRPAYLPGDTARLRLTARTGGTALVMVLSNRLIDMRAVAVPAGETVIDLPVTDDWGTGAYVTASLLRPMDVAAGRNPARALGLAHASVDPGARRLGAAFDAPAEADPRGPLDVALRVEGLAPGDTAHATIAAVDIGILNLTGFSAPDPEGHYFGQRRLGVGIRDLYGRLIDGMSGAFGQVRSGGDAGRTARLEAPPPTEELMAQFSGPLTVGADGLARARFDLPAFNGTVRLTAVVWSGRGVGQAQADVLVRDPVVVTASLPRFLAPGDDSRLLLELSHATGPAGDMALDLSASDGLTLGPAPARVALAAGGRAQVAVPVRAGATGAQTIRVGLTTPDGRRLERTLALPVQVGDPTVARQSRFTLDPGQTFTFDDNVFAGLLPGTGRATLAIGPLARFDAPGLLHRLDTYPYGCTEQITSRALPLLYLSDVAGAMGLGSATDIARRIDAAIAEVLLNQAADGGFGLWRALSGDLWLDAYVSDFLSRARARGHAVPDTAFRSAMDNLRNQVNFYPDFDRGGGDLAYALMVLAREGAAAAGDLRYYADQKAGAFDTPLALAQLGAALAHHGDPGRADALFLRAGRALIRSVTTAETAHFRPDYGSDLRDAAAILTLAAETGSTAVDGAALTGAIAAAARNPAISTQEASWALMAAHALLDRPGAEGFTIDGRPADGPLVQMLEGGRGDDAGARAIRNGSDAPAEVTLTTFGVPAVPEPAGGAGYRIERRYYTADGAPADPSAVAQGTRLVAVIEVAPQHEAAARLMVADPLPAGFEIDSPNLLRGGDVSALDWLDPTSDVAHVEFRQDRFLAAVDWQGLAPFRLAYRLRAVTPGSYHHPAASVEDMYRPDRRARTGTGRVEIAP